MQNVSVEKAFITRYRLKAFLQCFNIQLENQRSQSVSVCGVCVSALYLTSLKSKAIRKARWWAGLTVNSSALTEEACNKN